MLRLITPGFADRCADRAANNWCLSTLIFAVSPDKERAPVICMMSMGSVSGMSSEWSGKLFRQPWSDLS